MKFKGQNIILLGFVPTVTAWLVTFYDGDSTCSSGSTFYDAGAGLDGQNHLAQCYTIPSVNSALNQFDAKSVDVTLGGCYIDFFTDQETSPGLGTCFLDGTNYVQGPDRDGCFA